MRRFAVLLGMMMVLAGTAVAPAAVPGVTITLAGPAVYDPGVPVGLSGRLAAFEAAGIPLQFVEILVDGTVALGAQTGLDGGYNAAITLPATPPFTRTIEAVAHRGTLAETRSAPLTIQIRRVLTSISVAPANAVIRAGSSVAMTALGTYNDGSMADVTAAATWSSGNPGVASVAGSTVTGVAPGTATISATIGSVTGSTTVTVTVPPVLVINEVDYDQPGTDAQEFIEVFNPGSQAVDLSGIAIVLINGSGQVEYARHMLSGTLNAGSYAVLASPSVVVAPGAITVPLLPTTNGIQNGSPDGVVLWDTSTLTVIDALSYEGSITAAQISGASQTYNLVAGTPTPLSDFDVQALVRRPNGQRTGDDATDWQLMPPTPGASN